MPRAPRLYAGEQLRTLRRGAGLNQAAMAARLGISVSYLPSSKAATAPSPLR